VLRLATLICDKHAAEQHWHTDRCCWLLPSGHGMCCYGPGWLVCCCCLEARLAEFNPSKLEFNPSKLDQSLGLGSCFLPPSETLGALPCLLALLLPMQGSCPVRRGCCKSVRDQPAKGTTLKITPPLPTKSFTCMLPFHGPPNTTTTAASLGCCCPPS
jgi:hypothetical protein